MTDSDIPLRLAAQAAMREIEDMHADASLSANDVRRMFGAFSDKLKWVDIYPEPQKPRFICNECHGQKSALEISIVCAGCLFKLKQLDKPKAVQDDPDFVVGEVEAALVKDPGGRIWWVQGKAWVASYYRVAFPGRPATPIEAYKVGAIARHDLQGDYLEGVVQVTSPDEIFLGNRWYYIKDCTLVKPAPEAK